MVAHNVNGSDNKRHFIDTVSLPTPSASAFDACSETTTNKPPSSLYSRKQKSTAELSKMEISHSPPAHIPSHVLPVCEALLTIGGTLWTVCYVLLVRESLRSKSYGMPLFALALNLGWEFVYAFYVSEKLIERVIFTVWLCIDCGLVYGVLEFGKHEWSHAPTVARNLGMILALLTVVAAAGHWCFARWWIENVFAMREGKPYRGVVGPDITELGFWTAAISQAYLSGACLSQLIVRQHSGGVSWEIWFTRTFGSITGLYLNYAWAWYFWNESHKYVMTPFSIFLCGFALLCDLAYAFVLLSVKQTEVVLSNGRKVNSEAKTVEKSK